MIPILNFLYTNFILELVLQTTLNHSCGLAFADSIKLPVCANSRIHSHKVFKRLTKRGKDSVGWFYGFKLHLDISFYTDNSIVLV